jgi:mRNA interferase MazF
MARGDVLLVDLPPSDGREQSGRRPAIAVQTNILGEPMLMVAPVTSSLAALKYKFAVRVEPSPENGLSKTSVIMVFQMKAIDKRRIVRCLGHLSAEDLTRMDAEIWRMLKPDDTDAG